MPEDPWDRAARGYARQEHLEHQSIDRALELLAPQADEALLDVATGTGLVLRRLARRDVVPSTVVGLDASAEMLARVGPLPAGWRAERGDATALPFAAGSFDVATAAYLLQVLDASPRAATLRELHRVVRPGGRLVVITPWSARRPARMGLTGLARAAPATLGGLNAHDPRADLVAAGWLPVRAAELRGGYPSLVVACRRS